MPKYVPESAIDYEAIFRHGGKMDHGDEDFEFFKCPSCQRIYLLEYEVGTVFYDPHDLSKQLADTAFQCVGCKNHFPTNTAWIGERAKESYRVTPKQIIQSDWLWCIKDLGSLYDEDQAGA